MLEKPEQYFGRREVGRSYGVFEKHVLVHEICAKTLAATRVLHEASSAE